MTRFRALLICACILAMTANACTRAPDLADKRSEALRSASYPTLLPLDQLIVPLPAPQADSAALEQELTMRSSRLQSRARAINPAP